MIQSDPGTYVLWLQATDAPSVAIGALGTLDLHPGPYLYIGSALGPGGVRARVRRHARTDKRRHWHIDHLRAVTTFRGAWVAYDDARHECAWAQHLQAHPDGCLPLPGFGASDCSCAAHMIRLNATPNPSEIAAALQRHASGAPSVHWIDQKQMHLATDGTGTPGAHRDVSGSP